MPNILTILNNGQEIPIPAIKGADGITPHIGANGNWFIGDEDTGVSASGGGGSTGGGEWVLADSFTLEEDVAQIKWTHNTAVNEIYAMLQGVVNNETNDLTNALASAYIRAVNSNDKHSSNLISGKSLFYVRTSGSFKASLSFVQRGNSVEGHGMLGESPEGGSIHPNYNHWGLAYSQDLIGFFVALNTGEHRFKAGMTVEVYVR